MPGHRGPGRWDQLDKLARRVGLDRERLGTLAEAELAAGRPETAKDAFFRSSNYFRTAGVMLMGTPVDERLRATNGRQTEMFRKGAALLAQPPEVLAIPYEDTTLPGYHFQVDGDDRPRPTVVLLGGYDGTAEELYFFNGARRWIVATTCSLSTARGRDRRCMQQGLVLRPDFETGHQRPSWTHLGPGRVPTSTGSRSSVSASAAPGPTSSER